jgi:hypothetical protein
VRFHELYAGAALSPDEDRARRISAGLQFTGSGRCRGDRTIPEYTTANVPRRNNMRLTSKRNGGNERWLSSDINGQGVHVESELHDGRYLEIRTYDHDDPADGGRWQIHITDRETGRFVTLYAQNSEQRKTSELAKVQIGLYYSRKLKAA